MLQNPDDNLDIQGSSEKITCADLSIMNAASKFMDGRSLENVGNADVSDQFIESLARTEEDIERINVCTRGQNNSDWHSMRKGMLTASNFRNICKSVENERCPPSLLKTILGKYEEAHTAALNWGRKKERKALHLYMGVSRKLHKLSRLNQPGLLVYKNLPYIGCSADGVFTCKCHMPKLLEVKCPYSLKDSHPKEVALLRGCQMVNDNLVLQPDSDYFHQVQGQMGIYGFDKCDLIIYTKQGICTVSVDFDNVFFESMLEKLSHFFKEKLLIKLFEETQSLK